MQLLYIVVFAEEFCRKAVCEMDVCYTVPICVLCHLMAGVIVYIYILIKSSPCILV